MSDAALHKLACRAGLLVDWIDAADRPQRVRPDALKRILSTLGFPCDTESRIEQSLHALEAAGDFAPLVTADIGSPIPLPNDCMGRARLTLEDGTVQDVAFQTDHLGRPVLAPIAQAGYHTLEYGRRSLTIAVAPPRCFTLADAAAGHKLWGLSVQLPGLRRPGDGGIGDTGALIALARSAARHGADAVAISPTHALFGARPDRFSPYSPSNRLLLNPLLADPTALPGVSFAESRISPPGNDADALIDWPAAAQRKLADLHRLFAALYPRLEDRHDLLGRDFHDFCRDGGENLENHARFEVIHAVRVIEDPSSLGWRDWPEEFSAPDRPEVAAFAAAHAREVTFHLFLQWLAARAFRNAQEAARDAGMRIGLISDLAVGMEGGGSFAWAHRADVLDGLKIGAPPDLFNKEGQDWGLTTFTPYALRARGFVPFLATLRAALRQAGGLRIDHILGLQRLWVIPDGVAARDGAYLSYPFDDLLRLVCLESQRARAVVIGEDLGTVPPGFRDILSKSGIAGMDVLWFARDADGFRDSCQWREDAVAMSSTHDLPTVAGWWRGADINFHVAQSTADEKKEEATRRADRTALWQTFTAAGVASAPPPPRQAPAPAVDAAVAFLARSCAPLALIPLEDMLGLEEQPNIPGTIDEHPNWRRRYPVAVGDIFEDPHVSIRAAVLNRRREA